VLGDNSITLDGSKHLVGAAMVTVKLIYHGPSAAVVVNSGKDITTAYWAVRELTIDCQHIGSYGLRIGHGQPSPVSANVGIAQSLTLQGATQAGLRLTGSQINSLLNHYALKVHRL
jgi:hypothetical protein